MPKKRPRSLSEDAAATELDFYRPAEGAAKQFLQRERFELEKGPIKSPPNEMQDSLRPQVLRGDIPVPVASIIGFTITDELIAKYQKMDSVMNYGIEKADSFFTSYLMMKNLLSNYFQKYSEATSSIIHTLSESNLNYILAVCDPFDEEDITVIYKVGTYDQFYARRKSQMKFDQDSCQNDFMSDQDIFEGDEDSAGPKYQPGIASTKL